MQRTTLDGLAVFLAVAEHQGFRAAARQLDLTPSAVSQSIRTLEQRIGAPLFSRTTRSVGLTEAGQQLLAHARPAADLFTAGIEAARGLGELPSGHLRINTTRSSLPLLINRLIPDFHRAYPNIQLELVGEDELINIVEQGFDAGIRLGHVVELDMVSIWLTPPEQYVVAGSPYLLNALGRPLKPEDLQAMPAILMRRNGQVSHTWEFRGADEPLRVKVDGPLTVNESQMAVLAAIQGAGLVYTVQSLITDHINEGRLEVVLANYAKEVPGLHLYYPNRNHSLPKLRAFIEFATHHLRRGIDAKDFALGVQKRPG